MAGDTAAAHVDQRVERGVRVELADRLEHLLAASHAGQPVVDKRDSWPADDRPAGTACGTRLTLRSTSP